MTSSIHDYSIVERREGDSPALAVEGVVFQLGDSRVVDVEETRFEFVPKRPCFNS